MTASPDQPQDPTQASGAAPGPGATPPPGAPGYPPPPPAPGYPPQSAGAPGYPPQPGYPVPQYPGFPPGVVPMTVADERLWSMLAHLSGLVLSIIGPVIILAVYGKRSAFVKDQSTEALNFQITFFIATMVCVMLAFVIIGLFLLPVVIIGGIIFMIIGGIKANGGELYRYPINIRMVK